ncbi:MAG: tRNA pseudouridine(38-40) synthase TruA [Gammaproteobacteria bacterium]|nr:tRNA pseudouridine(38-40) synthase TruA [Gammaproteobacteria bacterium]
MRIAVGIEYDGSSFCGWQSQAQGTGVQAVVEAALSVVANEPIVVQCAGRTDAGVHAVCQVAHFDSHSERTPRAWTLGANSHLPRSVSLRWAQVVPEHFNARFSAEARSYSYVLLNRLSRPGLWHGRVSWEHRPLALERMRAAATPLLGEHDFSAFRAAGCQARHPRRTIRRLELTRTGDLVCMNIEANAFLQHMVRNIVGVLVKIGAGERPIDWAAEVLAGRDRRLGGVTAPAAGLYFLRPHYPATFSLPVMTGAPAPLQF